MKEKSDIAMKISKKFNVFGGTGIFFAGEDWYQFQINRTAKPVVIVHDHNVEHKEPLIPSFSRDSVKIKSRKYNFGKKGFTIDCWITFPPQNGFLTKRFLERV